MTTMTAQATQVYQLFIKATPEAIWDAITKPEFTIRYYHGARIENTPERHRVARAGRRDLGRLPDARVRPAAPARARLAVALRPRARRRGAESRVTWEIEPQEGGYCLLTVTHDQLDGSPKTAESVSGTGWMMVLSGLKTLLETGDVLDPDRG